MKQANWLGEKMNSIETMQGPACPVHCLVRDVPEDFANCLQDTPAKIDLATAKEQHRQYVNLLKTHVDQVTYVPSPPGHPDSVYIEDVAVITGQHALVTRPGAPSRTSEIEGIEAALRGFCTVHLTEAPATLDGGDVMQIGKHLLVGLSDRTNEAGYLRLAEVAKLDGLTAHRVPVEAGLHLKSAMTVIDHETIIYDPSALSPVTIPGLDITWLAAPEPLGANVLAFDKVTIVSADAPQTAKLLRERGYPVETVQVTEFHKGDGALSCLSLRISGPNGWTV